MCSYSTPVHQDNHTIIFCNTVHYFSLATSNIKYSPLEQQLHRVKKSRTLSLLCIGQINLSDNLADLILVSCNLADLTQQIAKFWQLEDIIAEKRQPTKTSEFELIIF